MNLNKQDLLELDAAGGELRTALDAVEAAECKFRTVCARIGAIPDLGQPGADPARRRDGRPRKTVAAEPATAADAGQKRARVAQNCYKPDKSIRCAGCGTTIRGVRYQGGVAYPYGHPDPTNPGHKCAGSNLPGAGPIGDVP